ncbi:hypothetical protein PGT21_035011 [Puccinia graminis f. sp. tritici]|uniref:Uncharacterized protein n=1 Tax=Puccinia graminis f. sp. tritici TaxID=56615 RepID=A0A5B0PZU2_PUCGR|nr:hypothetical protein PGT21_035011 [Puccinia graminis f. sp. tritici]KAA1126367.1 hypothetical protein PGTUg99_029551 [Puccinia graminis f. sp. tritici]
MFTRLIILTMWSSSSTLGMAIGTKFESHVERRAVEHLWALPASPPAVEMQQLSPKRFSRGIFIKDPFSANKKEDVEDRKFLFKYIEGSPQFESLNTEEYLKLVKDKEQHKKMSSLYQDSRDLEFMFQTVGRNIKKVQSEKLVEEQIIEKYSEAFKISKEFKRKISIFKKVKFWEILRVDSKSSPNELLTHQAKLLQILLTTSENEQIPLWLEMLPPELISLIPDKIWKDLASSFLDEIQKHILHYKIEPDSNLLKSVAFTQVYCFPHCFKFIDFLYKNEFIDSQAIRSIFQNRAIQCLAKKCTHHYVASTSHRFPDDHILDINEHWFWPFGFKFYEVLSKEDKVQIHLPLLISNLQDAGKSLLGFDPPEEWEFISNSLKKYSEYLEKEEESEKTSKNVESLDSIHQQTKLAFKSEKEFQDDVENLLKLLFKIHISSVPQALTYGREYFTGVICEFLDFVEKNFYQGIIRLVCDTRIEKDTENPEDQYHSLLISSRIMHLGYMARMYKIFCVHDMGDLKNHPKKTKYVRRAYIDRILELYPELLIVTSKDQNRKPLPWWLNENTPRKLLIQSLKILENPSAIRTIIDPGTYFD